MDHRAGCSAFYRFPFLPLFRGQLPESEDVFDERAGRYEVVAVYERRPETADKEIGIIA